MADNTIKVVIRSRPLIQKETKDVLQYTDNELYSNENDQFSCYRFDKVFNPNSSTVDVYNYTINNIVQQVVEGYNGTVFAYGQTSSGKTHTMVGSDSSPGIISLSIQQIFKMLEESNKGFQVWVTYLEIYNEQINDLLCPSNKNLIIREHATEGYYVAGLKQVQAFCEKDALQALQTGESNKIYRETRVHDHSSRCHSLFRIVIETFDKVDTELDDENQLHIKRTVRYSVLNLVDLAGSERIKHAGLTQETSFINTSLFVLTKVMNKLSENAQHIPYRESKLTKILQNGLGGNSLTAIICTVSPDIKYIPQTLMTLQFANRARNILTHPQINELIDDSRLVATYKLKIDFLEAKNQELVRKLNSEMERRQEESQVLREVINGISDEKVKQYIQVYDKYVKQTEETNGQVLGFDELKMQFEQEYTEQVQKCDSWKGECAKLKDDYINAIKHLNNKFWSYFLNIIQNRSPQSIRKALSSDHGTSSI